MPVKGIHKLEHGRPRKREDKRGNADMKQTPGRRAHSACTGAELESCRVQPVSSSKTKGFRYRAHGAATFVQRRIIAEASEVVWGPREAGQGRQARGAAGDVGLVAVEVAET